MKTLNLHLSRINFLGLMAILIIISVFMTMGARAQALEWHTTNQATYAWDAVTKNQAGDTIPDTDVIEYTVYTVNSGTPKPYEPASKLVVRTAETQVVLTFTEEGSYFIGIRAHRTVDDEEVGQSVIVWSDDPVSTNDKPFGTRYYLPPASVEGIRKPEPDNQ
jgi:hypothetical protein